MSLENQSRIRELDGWRAVSVLLIIVHHLFVFRFPLVILGYPALADFCADAGPLGVRVFFVISGFVICRLIISEELRFGSISLKGFYYRRIFRILPPFYLFLATLAVLQTADLISVGWKAIVVAGLFLTNLKPGSYTWFAGHTWSLAVEEQFYLIFPTLMVLSRRRVSWRGPLFGGLFLLLAARDLLVAYHGWHAHVATSTKSGFSCICAGILMAMLERHARRLATRVPSWAMLLIGFVILVDPLRHLAIVNAVFHSLLEPPAIGLILIYSTERGPWLRAFLCSLPVQAVGLTSYGIYLWQELFTGSADSYHGAGIALSYLLPLLGVVVPISYFLIEKPAIQLGKSLSRQARRADSDRRALGVT